MKRIITILILTTLFFNIKTNAQQLAFYSIYQNNWQVINPAAPNMAFLLDVNTQNIVNVAYRQQWIGVKGSPFNYNIYFESVLKGKNKRAKVFPKWGVGLYGESAGPLMNNTAFINYAYPIALGNGRTPPKLYIGFNAGYLNQRVDLNNIQFQNPTEQAIIDFSNQLSFLNSRSIFEFTPGIFYTNSESYYIGLSAPRLLTTTNSKDAFQVLNNKPQIHLIAGAKNQNLTLQPTIWLRWQPGIQYQTLVNNAPVSLNINLRSKISDAIRLGGGLSTGKWAHLECGWFMNMGGKNYNFSNTGLTIYFAYDVPLAKTGFQLGQTAEVNFIFSL